MSIALLIAVLTKAGIASLLAAFKAAVNNEPHSSLKAALPLKAGETKAKASEKKTATKSTAKKSTKK